MPSWGKLEIRLSYSERPARGISCQLARSRDQEIEGQAPAGPPHDRSLGIYIVKPLGTDGRRTSHRAPPPDWLDFEGLTTPKKG